jgi:hypothetical protein
MAGTMAGKSGRKNRREKVAGTMAGKSGRKNRREKVAGKVKYLAESYLHIVERRKPVFQFLTRV